MTVIAWDGKTLACDRQATTGSVVSTVRKLFRRDDGALVAYSGGMVHGLMLVDWFLAGADPDAFPKKPEGDQEDGNLTVVFRRGDEVMVQRYEGAARPLDFMDRFHAWGSGRELAIGAMAAGADALRAEAVRCAVLALRADPDCEADDAVSVCRDLGLRSCETGGCPDCLVVRKDDPRSVDEIVAAVGRRG